MMKNENVAAILVESEPQGILLLVADDLMTVSRVREAMKAMPYSLVTATTQKTTMHTIEEARRLRYWCP